MLTEQLQEAEDEFHKTRSRNFEFAKAEEKNLKRMAAKKGNAASIEAGTTKM